MIHHAVRCCVLILALAASRAVQAQGLVVDVEAAEVQLGDVESVGLSASLSGAPALPTRWLTQLGSIAGGRYWTGDRLAPGVVIVVAEVTRDGQTWRGARAIRLVGRGTLPAHTAAGASVVATIGGRTFGPFYADQDGNVEIPVEVPPEADTAELTAVDPNGLSTVEQVLLPRAPYPRAIVVAPPRLTVGERGVVTVFAVERDGSWRVATSPPEFQLDETKLRAVGEPEGKDGRWDLVVEGVAVAVMRVEAVVDGAPAVGAELEVVAIVVPPELPRPPKPRRIAPRFVWTLGLGALTTTGGADGPPQWGGAVSLAVGRERNDWRLDVGASVAGLMASETSATVGTITVTELDLGLGAGLRRRQRTWSAGAEAGIRLRGLHAEGATADQRMGSAERVIPVLEGGFVAALVVTPRLELELRIAAELALRRQRFAIEDEVVLDLGPVRGTLGLSLRVAL